MQVANKYLNIVAKAMEGKFGGAGKVETHKNKRVLAVAKWGVGYNAMNYIVLEIVTRNYVFISRAGVVAGAGVNPHPNLGIIVNSRW